VLHFRPSRWDRWGLDGRVRKQADCVISAVGSLSETQMRLAGTAEATTLARVLEIPRLSGTLSADGAPLQIALANASGAVIGGHLATG
jgi:uncharacterized protein